MIISNNQYSLKWKPPQNNNKVERDQLKTYLDTNNINNNNNYQLPNINNILLVE